jgi:hypothetical protein
MRNYYVPGAWNVTCDRCGFNYKSFQLREEWTGLMVCETCFEHRHPQDLIRARKDDPHVPWVRAGGNGANSLGLPGSDGLGPGESFIDQPQDTLTILGWHQIPIDRFSLKYFRADGPRTTQFALTSTDTTLSMDFLMHQTNDLIGLIWESVDTKDHLLLGYSTDKDYSDVTWSFDIALSATMPVLNDPTQAISITLRGRDQLGAAVDYFVPIFRYCNNPTGRTARVSIDFSTVKAGFFADQPTYVHDLDQVFISAVVTGYSGASSAPLGTPIQGQLSISNQVVGGAGAKIMLNRMTISPRHTLGMSTSYDDHYDVSPQRVLENIDALGFAKYINHYCGMSIFPNTKWDGVALRYLTVLPATSGGVDPVISPIAKLWHQNWAALLQAGGWSSVWSISYETFSNNAHTDWVQKDWNSVIGTTGYSPPSYLLSPGVDAAMNWLKQAAVEFATIMNAAGQPVKMQVGEPWWWYQPSTLKPCIYDNDTRIKFNVATGLFMADFGTINSTLTGAPYDQMKTFCRDLLGDSVLAIRTAVRAAFPTAQVSALVFLPTIIGYGIMETINLPNTKYHSANLDFFQTEAYDWIINNRMDLTPQAMTYPITTLGYAANKVEYLAGFVPSSDSQASPTSGTTGTYDEASKKLLWKRIVGNIKNNIDNYGPARQYIWAYTLAMRDSMTFINNNYDKFFFYLTQLTPQRT